MATEYQRGYGKGYAAGYRRAMRWADKLIAACRRFSERTERAESGSGIGHCRDCRFCIGTTPHWGNCTKYATGSQAVDDPWFGENSAIFPRIAPPVSLNFGCVLYAARDTSIREGGGG